MPQIGPDNEPKRFQADTHFRLPSVAALKRCIPSFQTIVLPPLFFTYNVRLFAERKTLSRKHESRRTGWSRCVTPESPRWHRSRPPLDGAVSIPPEVSTPFGCHRKLRNPAAGKAQHRHPRNSTEPNSTRPNSHLLFHPDGPQPSHNAKSTPLAHIFRIFRNICHLNTPRFAPNQLSFAPIAVTIDSPKTRGSSRNPNPQSSIVSPSFRGAGSPRFTPILAPFRPGARNPSFYSLSPRHRPFPRRKTCPINPFRRSFPENRG